MTTTPPPSMIARMAVAMQHTSAGQPFSWENAARAALGELRAPTEAMIAAAQDAIPDEYDYGVVDSDMEKAFTAAIDAALAEGK